MAMALRVTVERLANDVAGDEGDVGRALREPAHEIRIPLGAEGHVAADAIPFLHERFLEVAADAVEHLELEAVDADSLLLRPALGLVDHRRVVAGDARV